MIRKAIINDIDSLVKIEKMVFTESLGESFLYDEFLLNPFAHYFVYELNGQIIGYIGYRAIDANAEMMNFCMDPNYQGQGFGSQLFEHSVQYLKELKVKSLLLEVRKSNKKAQAFYERYGFTKSHIRKNYYKTEDAYVLIKEV
ncbi:MAG: ribosomal-protein-alanine N-acetyltransferase [Tenericutes bacterium HGW-Tenericutes-3]|nr:MAG: ribosomal-protein-alanine N-acetyltransferase [Tenericutes bacterium HGW-Tenericutes-3]